MIAKTVRVYPENTLEVLGATRWQVETWIVPKGWDDWSEEKKEAFDPASHTNLYDVRKTEAGARKLAATWLKRDDLAFGSVTVVKQVVGYLNDDEAYAEWMDVGTPEEI